MIDFHNHLLPNLDDGAKSMEMTLDMLREASNQGIKKIVNTVHFQHPKMERKNIDYNHIQEIRDRVLKEAAQIGIKIDIELASEVYYLPNLCDLVDNPIATINGYMLIEFPAMIVPSDFLDIFFNLKMKGINPILAHPERYRFIQQDVNNLNKLNDLEIIFQIDAGSLVGHFGNKTKKIAFNMLKEGYCHIIGSDAHNNIKRNFCLKEAYNILSVLDDSIVDKLMHNSACIVEHEKALKPIKLKKQSFFQRLKKKTLNT